MDILHFPERFMRANAYLIRIGDDYTLIDPSLAPAALDQVAGEGAHLSVRRLVATHPHYDHIVYLDHWRDEFALPLYIHEQAQDILEDPERNASVVFGREVRYDKTAHLLRESAKIRLAGGYYLTAVYLPGHTEADILLTLRHDDGEEPLAIFAGDIFFADSIGRSDFPGSDPKKQVHSLERLARLLMIWPEETPVYAGHGRLFTVGEVLRGNAYIMAAAEQVKRKYGKVQTRGEKTLGLAAPARPYLVADVPDTDLVRLSIAEALALDIVQIGSASVVEGRISWQATAASIEGMQRLRAIHPSVRLVLSVRIEALMGLPDRLASAAYREGIADSAKKLLLDYDLDGLNLVLSDGLEGEGSAAILAGENDPYLAMLRELRSKMTATGDSSPLLSLTVGDKGDYVSHSELERLSRELDYLVVRAEDTEALQAAAISANKLIAGMPSDMPEEDTLEAFRSDQAIAGFVQQSLAGVGFSYQATDEGRGYSRLLREALDRYADE